MPRLTAAYHGNRLSEFGAILSDTRIWIGSLTLPLFLVIMTAPQLLLDGEPLDDFPNEFGVIEPVGGDNDWYRYEKTFVAEFDAVTVRIQNEPDLGLDATLLVDNVSLHSTAVNPFDCNGDGSVDAADLECACTADVRDGVLAETGLLEGDLDGNGSVEFADFLVLSANFGTRVDSYTQGDIDCEGEVAFADFLVLSANFGQSAADTAAVPEPTCLGLAWLAVASMLLRGRTSISTSKS